MKSLSAKKQCSHCSFPFSVWNNFFTFLLFGALFINGFNANGQVAIAPVSPPVGGFHINGLLEANSAAGDWVDDNTNATTGGAVYTRAGDRINPLTSFLFRDPYNSALDNIFATGNQGNANPANWHWSNSSAPNKNEIHNGLLHITTDATGDSWAIVGGDRLSTTGTAYIDVEFLQNTLETRPLGTTSANVGDFYTEGPHGGRTVNDLLVTMEYNNGGGQSELVFYRWREISPGSGTYDYFEITAPATAFAYTNTGTVNVPFGAFNRTTYTANQFVEGAVNLTDIISSISPCLGLSIKTIMIKTKASSAASATLKDFIEPAQVALDFGFTVAASATPNSLDLAASNTSQLSATGVPGPNSLYGFSWVQVTTSPYSSGGTLSSSTIANPTFTATEAGTYKFVVTATQLATPFCSATDEVVITVVYNPVTCGVSGPSPICPGTTNEYFYDHNKDGVRDSLPANFTSSWSFVSNSNGAIINWGATTRTSITAGSTCNSSYRVRLTLTSTSGLVIVTCDSLVTVADQIKPTISCPTGSTLQCEGLVPAAPANLAAFLAMAGASAGDNCDNALDYSVNTGPLVGNGCGGTITRTFTVTDNCGNTNSCNQVFTINDNTKPIITCPAGSAVQCLSLVPAAPTTLAAFLALTGATASDNCDNTLDYSVTTGPLVGGSCGGTVTRTFTVTDNCGNTNSCTQVFTVNDNTKPTISCPAGNSVQCLGDIPVAPATLQDFLLLAGAAAADNCDNSLSYSVQTGLLTGGGCGGTVTRTFTVTDDCGNTNTCTQVFIVNDNTQPSISCPSGGTVDCLENIPAAPASLAAFLSLGGTASDNCDPALTYSVTTGPLVGGGCGGTVTRTHKVTDDCGNFRSCEQVFTVDDNTAPVITSCPPDKYLYSCTASTLPANTGSATATDNCATQVTPSYSDAAPIANGCQRIIIRTWTATDACGNTATCIQRLFITDRTAPIIICPVEGDATATDDCGGTPYVFYTDNGGIRTWTAIDASGNSSSCTQPLAARPVGQPSPENKEVNQANATTGTKSTGEFVPAVPALRAVPALKAKGIQLNAFPNPYLNEVNFRFSSSRPGTALLEVFDLLGRKIAIVYQGRVEANIQQTINYKIPVLKSIPMVYQLTIGAESTRGKLLPLKQ